MNNTVGNRAPISACMITRDDPNLEKCILSFRDHVQQVCVLITSKEDIASYDTAVRLGCKVEVFTDCNLDGLINDFSMARNKSFEMADQPWIMWLDSDDIISGAENLNELINSNPITGDGIGYVLPYEYSYDANGVVTCKHYRERLISNKNSFHFIGPVHEVMIPKADKSVQLLKSDLVVWKHQRQYYPKAVETGRNLRILKEFVKNNPNDARNQYYIGLEFSNNNDKDNAIKYLSNYIEISGWDDERAMACYKLVEIYQALNDQKLALKFAMKSLEIKSDWFESYYAVCKVFYFMNQWQKCIDFGKLALDKPKTETLLFINEADRHEIHSYLNVAYNGVGNVTAALESVNEGLKGNPNNSNLLNNKIIYEKFLNIKINSLPLNPTNNKNLNIIFMLGPAHESWSPETIKKSGIGGSELMAAHQAKNLTALGHSVRMYAMAEGTFDGVEYIHYNKYKNLTCDILIVSRNASFLADNFNVSAKLKLLWLHDVFAINATNELLLKADKILCLSEWHKQNVMKIHNLHNDHILVTRNGIDMNRFKKNIVKNPYKLINSSSPDRSWAVLIECFKEIKKQVPLAELHLYYGFANWKAAAAHDPLNMDLIKRLETAVNETEGIVFHDRVNQEELADAFMESKIWVYSTWFQETSCLSCMEARAADCWIVTSPIAALNETAADYDKTVYIQGEWTSKEYMDSFVFETVKILKDGK